MAFNLTPVLDYIVLQRIEQKSGIHLPFDVSSATVPAYAKVVAVGPGRPSEYSAKMLPSPPCEVGDTVLFHGGAGTKVEINGKEYLFIKPADLMAVVS